MTDLVGDDEAEIFHPFLNGQVRVRLSDDTDDGPARWIEGRLLKLTGCGEVHIDTGAEVLYAWPALEIISR